MIADDDSVRVYDINDSKWCAAVERASGNFGQIADVSFGHTANELLVFSDFGIKLVIWSLVTSRGVEIRDPKYMARCYAYRPKTGHLAILTRPAAQDTLMLLNPGTHSLIKSFDIPSVDAQEIAWSPDGRWLIIRDAASSGHKMLIYTADGHLFRTYLGAETDDEIGLGIKGFLWESLSGVLAIGDYNDTVTILSRNTVIEYDDFHCSDADSKVVFSCCKTSSSPNDSNAWDNNMAGATRHSSRPNLRYRTAASQSATF